MQNSPLLSPSSSSWSTPRMTRALRGRKEEGKGEPGIFCLFFLPSTPPSFFPPRLDYCTHLSGYERTAVEVCKYEWGGRVKRDFSLSPPHVVAFSRAQYLFQPAGGIARWVVIATEA